MNECREYTYKCKLHDFVIWEYFTHQKGIIHILTQLGNALQIHARYAAIYHKERNVVNVRQ